ncbi:MAG: alpha/beta hydrolase [Rhodothermales bacterium]|nr:alpha/beta hydrolase [Rhodothermales bacterium]
MLLLAAALAGSGCFAVNRIGVAVLYDKARLPEAQIREDVAYYDGPGADAEKHRLDLFVPAPDAAGWPTVIFIHGGGWTSGDKDLKAGGADVYRNIGRFFAARGIGAAVINYRLLPGVDWTAQIEDVARAVAWVHGQVGGLGGDPDALFLMGHSAGAQLAARVALDPAPLTDLGLRPAAVCGVIAVSGAAYDAADPETYALGGSYRYLDERFGGTEGWEDAISPVRFIDAGAPPFLVLYAGGESKALQHQSRLLDAALREAGAASRLVEVPGESHARIVLTLSRDDKTAGPAMLDFIRAQDCVAQG